MAELGFNLPVLNRAKPTPNSLLDVSTPVPLNSMRSWFCSNGLFPGDSGKLVVRTVLMILIEILEYKAGLSLLLSQPEVRAMKFEVIYKWALV